METENKTVDVGGKHYLIVKRGRAQAAQVLSLTRWLANYGVAALNAVQEKDYQNMTGLSFLSNLVQALDEDALVGLFQVVTGCANDEAEEYFDVATLIDTVVILYNEQPAIQRLITRFLPGTLSTGSTEPTPIASDLLTDGTTAN